MSCRIASDWLGSDGGRKKERKREGRRKTERGKQKNEGVLMCGLVTPDWLAGSAEILYWREEKKDASSLIPWHGGWD